MKQGIVGLIVSVLIHVLLLLFVLLYRFETRMWLSELEMEFIGPGSGKIEVTKPENASRPLIKPGIFLPEAKVPGWEDNFIAVPDTFIADSLSKISPAELFVQTSQYFIKKSMAERNFDSLVLSTTPKPHWRPDTRADRQAFMTGGGPGDPIANQLRKETTGQTQTIPVGNLVAALIPKKENLKPAPRLHSVPTRVQLHALNVLWEKKKATVKDIYAEMDSSFILTASILEEIMDGLYQEHLVNRRKISPSNEFTITGPLLNHGIEMSELNRKNVDYEYSPRIQRAEVIRYLQSRLYWIQEQLKDVPDDFKKEQIKELIERIQQILPES